MSEKHLKKEMLRKGPGSLFKILLWEVFNFFLWKPGFFISGTSTPNKLFQTSIELERLIDYSKQLH